MQELALLILSLIHIYRELYARRGAFVSAGLSVWALIRFAPIAPNRTRMPASSPESVMMASTSCTCLLYTSTSAAGVATVYANDGGIVLAVG